MTFAYAYDPSQQRFAFVFNFMPPGNFYGNYSMNVGKPKMWSSPEMHEDVDPAPPETLSYHPGAYTPPYDENQNKTSDCFKCCRCMSDNLCRITIGGF